MTQPLTARHNAREGALIAALDIMREEHGRLEGEKANLIEHCFSLYQQLHGEQNGDAATPTDLSFLEDRREWWKGILMEAAREAGQHLQTMPKDHPERQDLEHYASWLATFGTRLLPSITRTELTHRQHLS